jgi:CysZ protein
VSAGRARSRELAAALHGFALPAAALRLLLRERRLWPLAAVPLLLSALAVLGALAAVTVWAGPLHGLVTGLFPSLRAETWVEWLWVGPLGALYFVLGKLLFLLAAALAVVVAFALAGLLAAPFQDALSRRVEALVAGRVEERAASGLGGLLREGGRALREEARRLAFFLSASAAIAGFGLLIPGGQLLAAPALVALSMAFLTLDYAGYTLDRRGARFADKRRWLARHPGASLGFGGAALLLCAVPGLNLLALPVLVVAGTLLALRSEITPPGAAPGTATSP